MLETRLLEKTTHMSTLTSVEIGEKAIDAALTCMFATPFWKEDGGPRSYEVAINNVLEKERDKKYPRGYKKTIESYKSNGPYHFERINKEEEIATSDPAPISNMLRVTAMERRQVVVPRSEKLEQLVGMHVIGYLFNQKEWEEKQESGRCLGEILFFEIHCRVFRPHKEAGWHPHYVEIELHSPEPPRMYRVPCITVQRRCLYLIDEKGQDGEIIYAAHEAGREDRTHWSTSRGQGYA
jgi:hypothetical protein